MVTIKQFQYELTALSEEIEASKSVGRYMLRDMVFDGCFNVEVEEIPLEDGKVKLIGTAILK